MAWVRMTGQGVPPTQFPWNALTDGGITQTSISIATQQWGNISTTIKSPKITSSCRIKGRINHNASSPFVQVKASTDGVTWTQIGSNVQSQTGYIEFNLPASAYVNNEIYIQLSIASPYSNGTFNLVALTIEE